MGFAADRMKICRSCDHYWKATAQCGICKCFLKIKTKMRSKTCADTPKQWGRVAKGIK